MLQILGVNVTQSDVAVTAGWGPEQAVVLTGVDFSRLGVAATSLGATVTHAGSVTTYRLRADGKSGADDPPQHVLPSFLRHTNLIQTDGAALRFGTSAAAVQAVAPNRASHSPMTQLSQQSPVVWATRSPPPSSAGSRARASTARPRCRRASPSTARR